MVMTWPLMTAYGDDTAALETSVARWDAWFMERVG